MTLFERIHQNALRCSRRFKRSESDLVEAIQQVDAKKVFRRMGYNSLFAYCLRALTLSESNAYAFIGVARKSVEIPEIKEALAQGTLSVSQAKRITSVITPENKEEWIEKAQTLKQRDLEREVARVNPSKAVPETIKPCAEDRSELRCGVSRELEEKLRLAQDLLSQSQSKAVTLEETLEAMVEVFLERKDPVRRAQRNQAPSSRKAPATSEGKRTPIPAAIRHSVNLRDRRRCQHVYPDGTLCGEQRWTDLHHKIPVFRGGEHSEENLTTLCSTHHRHVHEAGASVPPNPRESAPMRPL